jgi:hypothetical protein
MDQIVQAVILFIISLLISAIIIYIVTKIFGEKEGFGTALLAAFVGAIIYTGVYYLFGSGIIPGLTGLTWVASILGAIGWLAALHFLYKMHWLKTVGIAIIIWIISAVIGYFLPTLATTGPL